LEHIKIARANILVLQLYDGSKIDVDTGATQKVVKRAGRPKRVEQPLVVEPPVKRVGRPKRAEQPLVVEPPVKRAGRPKRVEQPSVSRDKVVVADTIQSKAPKKERAKSVVPKKD